jgi:hypothetical protein
MAQAGATLKMNQKTFAFHAKRIGCYMPNPAGKGIHKDCTANTIPLKDILAGKHPQYHTSHLNLRLLKSGMKEHRCENCNNEEWLGKPIPLELHHKDGNSHNHKFKNLQFLFPNCHALTDNYCSKNKKTNQTKT